jgi:hypothetical protein
MKKTFVLLIAIFSLGFYVAHSVAAERIDLKLDDQIGIAFINKNMLLIMDEDESTLLVLDKDKLDNLKKFDYNKLNILTLRKNLINIDNKQELVFEDDYEIGDVHYTLENGLININYKDNNVCVYIGGGYNISNCQFIYFYNTSISDVEVYDYNEVVMYYYKNPLPTKVLEKIYEQSVDTYPLRDDELTVIKIGEDDYDFIVLEND